MTDPKDKTNEPEKKDEVAGPIDLSSVHDRAVREFSEPEEPKEDEGTDPEEDPQDPVDPPADDPKDPDPKPNEDPKDPVDPPAEDPKADDKPKDGEAPHDPNDALGGEPVDMGVQIPNVVEPPEKGGDEPVEPELKKVVVRDSDGTEHEFSSPDEIPDDFEPYSHKEMIAASTKMAENKFNFDRDHQMWEDSKAEKERLERVSSIQDQWKKEIDGLVEAGKIPKTPAERDKVVADVFNLMTDRAVAGTPIDSFEDALKVYSYDNDLKIAVENDKQNAKNQEKKAMGAKISGGGNPRSSGDSAKMPGPPPGSSVAQVHAYYQNQFSQ